MKHFLIPIAFLFFISVSNAQISLCGVWIGEEDNGDAKRLATLGGLPGLLQLNKYSLDNRVVHATFYPAPHGVKGAPISHKMFTKFIKKIKKIYGEGFYEDFEYPKNEEFEFDRLFMKSKLDFFIIAYVIKYLNNDKNRIILAFMIIDTRLLPENDPKRLWDKSE